MPSAAKAKREAAKAAKASSKSASKSLAADTALDSAPAKFQLVFPPALTARQRAAIHAVGEQFGLPHASKGDGNHRSIVLGPAEAPAIDIANLPLEQGLAISNEAPDDALLIELIQKHLKIDASAAFSSLGTSHGGGGNDLFPGSSKARSNGETTSRQPTSSLAITKTPGKHTDLPQFVAHMEELVEMERQAEVAAAEDSLTAATPEQAQSRGRALLNLRLEDAEGGLLGRTLLTLVRNKLGSSGEEALPQHKFSPHDIVRIRAAKGEPSAPVLAQGVVYRVKESSITVAVDDPPDEGLDVPLKLEKLANEVTYARLKAAIKGLGSVGGNGQGPAAPLVEVLFSGREPKFAPAPVQWKPVNSGLDSSQKVAVNLALTAADMALIQGPPGTGKTTTVVEIILQEVTRGSRVLACAASNIAVDNLVERLAGQKLSSGGKKGGIVDVVRVGHPARLLPAVLDSSLEAKVLRSDDSALAKDCRKEIKDLNTRLLKLGRKDRAERTGIRRDLRRLAKEERQRQERAVAAVLSSASVICATLTGVGTRQLERLPPFDVVVIDEAAQALEPACWAALLRGRRAVLAGDHLQLPPTVTSEVAAKRGLGVTLFERAHALWGHSAAVMLNVQYRMNKSIMTWSSDELYDGRITAHASVAEHGLAELPSVAERSTITAVNGTANGGTAGVVPYPIEDLPVLLLIDTAGCDMEEEMEEGGESKMNKGEASVAMAHVRRLLATGIKPSEIGVITPYAAQVGLLRELRSEGLGAGAGAGAGAQLVEISTVDGFQGREKEAIVISMVRSNTSGEVGFLADNRRMNVAVTRARRQCALVCDTDTVKSDPFLKRLVEYFEEHGEYASAQEYVD